MRKSGFFLALLCIGVLIWQPASALSLGSVRNSLVQWVLDKVSVEDVFEISVENVVGAETEGTSLLGVEIADADGVWFTAEELTFSFSATRLLRGQLIINHLELDGVEIIRQPAVPAGEAIEVDLDDVDAPPEAPFYWPRSPITTAIEELVLDRVHLHREVLGHEISFDATGSFRDQGNVQQAALALHRTDRTEGVIDFDYARDFSADTLAINLDAREAPGGIVSDLAGLPPDVPVAISLNADGTPDAFGTKFDLALTDFVQADGTATIDYAGPLGIDAEFTVRPEAKMPEEYAQILGEKAKLVIRAHEGPDETVEIDTARLDSPYLKATMGGTWSRATGAIDAEIDLVADPELAAPIEGVAFSGLRFRGEVAGDPGTIAADGELVLNGLVTPAAGVNRATLDIKLRQEGEPEAVVTRVSADGHVAGLRIGEVGPEVIGDAELAIAVTADGDELRLDRFAIDSDVLNATGEAVADVTTWDFTADFGVNIADLAPMLDAYDLAGKGQIDASAHAVRNAGVMTLDTKARLSEFETDLAATEDLTLAGQVVQSSERTTFDLMGGAKAIRIDRLGPDVLERADLALSGSLQDDVLTLETARFDSPILDVAGEGRLNMATDTGQFGFDITAEDLAPVAGSYGFNLAGALAAKGTAALTPGITTLKLDAGLTDLAGDISSDRLGLKAEIEQTASDTSFDVSAESPNLVISLGGEELGGPVDLALQGALAGDQLTLATARINSPVLDADATAELDLAEFTGAISYDVAEARLPALAPLLGMEAAGILAAKGEADLAPGSGGAISASGTVSVADLEASGNFIGDVAADYDLGYRDVPTGTLQLRLTESPYAPDAPTVFALEMTGPKDDWALSFTLDAPDYLNAEGKAAASWEKPISIAVNASARPGEKLPAQYAELIGEKAELVAQAAEDADGLFQIETARLSSPSLNAHASGTYSTESSAADLDFRLVAEPELAAPFEGIEFAGLSLVGELKGSAGEIAATARLALDGFASPDLAMDSARLNLDIRQPPSAVKDAISADPADETQPEPEIHDTPRITSIRIDGNMDGLRFAGIGPEVIGDAIIRVDSELAGDELRIESARLDSDLVQLWANGRADTSTMEFDIDYRLATADLAPLAGAFQFDAGGALTASGHVSQKGSALALSTRAELTELSSDYVAAERITLNGKIRSRGSRTSFDLTGGATALGVEGQGEKTLGDAEFTARGALRGSTLALEQLEIDSPILDAMAEGRVDLDSGEGRISYDVPRLNIGAIAPVFDVDASGTASAEGVFGLAAATAGSVPRLKGEVRAADLVYAGSRIGDLALDHDVALSDNPNGTLDLRLIAGPYAPASARTAFRMAGSRLTLERLDARGFGATASGNLALDLDRMAADGNLKLAVAEGPFASAEATTRIALQNNQLRLQDLRATALDLEASGELSVNLDNMLAEGAISLARSDLSDLGQLLGTPMAGEGEGSIRLMPEGGRQMVALDFDLASVSAYGVAIRSARFDGRIVDALGTPHVDLTLAAERIRQGDMRLEAASLTAEGPLSSVRIAADADGKSNRRELAFAARADANLASAPMRITMTELGLALGEDRIELLAPMTILAEGGTARVQGMEIGLPDNGRLTGDLAFHGGPLAGALRLDAPDLAFLNRTFDVPVDSGALRLSADFDMRPGRAHADVTIAGREITATSISGAGPVALDASANWNGTILDLDARATGDFERPLTVQASLPVRATDGLPTLARSGPVSARIDWKGEIGDIWALVPVSGHVVTGHAEIDIGVSGDIARPEFTGGLMLEDGVYQNLDFGVILTGVSLATTVESAGALGVQLDAVDGAEGTVRLEGRIGFDEQGIDLTLETRRAVIIRRDDAVVRLDTDLRITEGEEGALDISGRVEILEAEIRLLLDNPPSIVTLGEVRVKGQPLVAGGNGQSLPIALDIDVVAPGRIFVRGRGLDSEWEMDLAVRGTASVPRITGDISAVRGRLDLIGRDFTLERGHVLFNGGPEIDPRLDVSLMRETSDITGRILISGSAFDPTLSFSSTPALPEDEVLPRLLFGTSSQALSPAQGLQLALGLATLLNGGGGTLDEFRSAIGLDMLSIEEGEEGAELSVGKQVAEDVWVGTRQSLEGGGTKFAVEVDVFKNVDAYGEVDTDGETSAGVRWKKDF